MLTGLLRRRKPWSMWTLWARHLLRTGIWPATLIIVVGMVDQIPALAARPVPPRTLAAQQVASVHGKKVRAKPRPSDLSQGADQQPRTAHVVWPAGATAIADLSEAGAAPSSSAAAALAATRRVRAGTTPVWLTSAGGERPVTRARVTVQPHDTAPAGWDKGVVLRLSRADAVDASAPVSITIDYSGFSQAFGADYGSRLRLVQIPACAMTSTQSQDCAATPLPTTNDTSSQTATAQVMLPSAGTVTVALTSGTSSSSGTFAATDLRPSSNWSAGDNSGDFSWQYPMNIPPSLGGPAPSVGLSYSSAAVDGRNATTNNQPSWVGEGFDFWPGSISRSYKPCADDQGSGANNTTATGDQCWGIDNAVLSMSGHSGELIKDDTSGIWRLKDDDNTKIEHLTGATNGDNDGEYWRLTTSDGTAYYFGLNRLPGYTGTAPANKVTNSAWTMPVAGNNSGEPCHATAFTASFCTQTWRWNLDYVVDPDGNTMSIFYGTETNKYARNNTDTDVQSYIRGGFVDHIDYGTDNRSGTDTEESSTAAPMRVQVNTGDRCLSSCTTHDVTHWPDTPWDQSCTSTTSCPGLYSPTFFITKRLATITTEIATTGATCTGNSGYKCVDSWTLTHDFPPSGDDTRNGMWLDSIVHSGIATGSAVVGPALTLPSVNFDWTQMPNRVDTTTDGEPPMNWMRMSTIWTESGAKISVRYTPEECSPTNEPTSPQNNTLRCYPVLEKQPDKTIKTEYFNKYLVSEVVQADQTGGAPDIVTTYTYVGNPAWRHADDDGMTQDNLRTWSDFRGYGQVNTQVGAVGQGQQTLSETTFFQGMNGDLNGSGGTRSVSLPAIDINGNGSFTDTADAPSVPDENAYSGTPRQTTVYTGAESAPVSTTVYQPWQSGPTATRDMGSTTAYARRTDTAATWEGTRLSGGGWQVTRSDTTFDSYGMPAQENDSGDVAASGDETCTKTSYNRNTSTNLLELPAEIDTYALPCGTNPSSDSDIISMNRMFYDQQSFTTPPTKGDATETDEAKAWTSASGPTWLTTSTSNYDAYGRPTDVTDVRGNHTTTTYTPATSAPVTSVATTTPLGTTTDTVEPSWGVTTASVDVNNKRTDVTYDTLGRTSQVWRPNHLKSSYPSQPSESYSYLIRATGGVNAVTTNTLNSVNAYTTTIALYDGLLRPRQTQSVSLANGHVGTVFTDTVYDDKGQTVQNSQYFDATVQPSTTLYAILSWQPASQTVTQYDLAGRVTAVITNNEGIEQWRATTTYDGNRTSVTPPPGGTATTTITDALGRTTQLRQYRDPANVGSDDPSTYDAVSYHYNRKSEQDSWTDNAGNTWTSTFDLLGRETSSHDPDKGTTTSTYNDYGDVLTATDARNTTLAYTYDSLGRKTGEYTPTTSGTKLATWAYDPTGAKGQVASQSRWVGTDEYKIKVNGYTALYQPTSLTYTIPASVTGLAGSYTFSNSYTVDGSTATQSFPNAGGLGAETLTHVYDTTDGLADQLQTNFPNTGEYVANTDYTAYGELSYESLQTTGGNFLQRSLTYDATTHRLNDALTIRQISPQAVDDTKYTYDPSGNITKIVETPASGAADTQCFSYDYAQRMTDAWTPGSGDCMQAKSASSLGGPAPYWLSWSFDSIGDRHQEISHAVGGDTTSTYTYPASGASSVRPHAVSSVTNVGPGINTTNTYGYDAIGDTTSRPGSSAQQTLTWDAEGHVGTLVDGTSTTNYLYTPDGSRLMQDDPNNTTVYLPGEDLVRNKSTGAVSATRYYSWEGQTIACISTGGRLTWLVTDDQNTQMLEVDAGSQTITQRRETPFGSPRGTQPTWSNPRGFVGGVNDSTGLVHEGDREYDPGIGRFLSTDPVFNFDDPQSWTNYTYVGNNPVTESDPSGMCPSWLCGTLSSVVNAVTSVGSSIVRGISSGFSWFHDTFDDFRREIAHGFAAVRRTVSHGIHRLRRAISRGVSAVRRGIYRGYHVARRIIRRGLGVARRAVSATRRAASATRHAIATYTPKVLRRTWQVTRLVMNAPITGITVDIAQHLGASCGMDGQELTIVCQNAPSFMYSRKGTTVGNVFLTDQLWQDPHQRSRELAHEAKHSDQFAIFGPIRFPILYFTDEIISGGGKNNIFERWAGLDDGCYNNNCTSP